MILETHRFVLEESQAAERIDKLLSLLCPEFSRARLQNLIEQGCVFIDGEKAPGASYKVSGRKEIVLNVPQAIPANPRPENIPLNIVYEDSDLLVLNKQAGLVVHPGAGNPSGTLVNALLYHCGEELSGIGGVLRPGILHRLDKDTSGLMVVAKTDRAHHGLASQLEDRSLSRVYTALVLGVPVPIKGSIESSLGRHPANRVKMAAGRRGGRAAKTHYLVQEDFSGVFSRVECRLDTGRTHQIRVHMESFKHPLIGDPLYGPPLTSLRAALKKGHYEDSMAAYILAFPRQALHASSLSFIHPVSHERLTFEIKEPEDIFKLLKCLKKADN